MPDSNAALRPQPYPQPVAPQYNSASYNPASYNPADSEASPSLLQSFRNFWTNVTGQNVDEDPKRLVPSVRGVQTPQSAISGDYYPPQYTPYQTGNLIEGQAKAGPTRFERARDFITNDLLGIGARGQAAGGIGTALDPEHLTQLFTSLAPLVKGGMSWANPKNILAVQKRIQTNVPAAPNLSIEGLQELRPPATLEYFKGRYPETASKSSYNVVPHDILDIPPGVNITDNRNINRTYGGFLSPAADKWGSIIAARSRTPQEILALKNDPTKIFLATDPRNAWDTMKSGASSLGHESIHGRQWAEDPVGLVKTYITPQEDWNLYHNQKWEQEARAVQPGVENTFQKFIDALRSLRPNSAPMNPNIMDLTAPVTRADFRNYILPKLQYHNDRFAMAAGMLGRQEKARVLNQIQNLQNSILNAFQETMQTGTVQRIGRPLTLLDVSRALDSQQGMINYLRQSGYTGVYHPGNPALEQQMNPLFKPTDMEIIYGR